MRHGWVLALFVVVVSMAPSRPSSAQTCTNNVPHVDGEWVTAPYLMPINPISATVLHDGRLLIVAGSENDASNNSPGAQSYRTAIWDPTGGGQSSIVVQNIDYDVFCSGTSILPDGRPLVVGGTADYSFKGESRASIFNPLTSQFIQTQSMADGRWYATATALGDGRVMTWSGLGLSGATNNTVEIFDLSHADAGWSAPRVAPVTPPLYPRMFLLPSGSVFFTGQGASRVAQGWLFNPVVSPPTWTASVNTTVDRTYGGAVLMPLLPPDYRPRVMNFGGGSTSTTEVIDLGAATPAWTAGPNLSSGRIQNNATLLPNGNVVVSGGSVNNESPSPAGKHADLYDASSNTIRSAGTASYSRLYHSVTILLPDATVAVVGSNPSSRGSYEPAIEIYTPAYLFDAGDARITANRPSVTGAPAVVGYGAAFSVSYTSASAITSAVLMRPGSSTHAFDMDQRLVGLCGPSPQPACAGPAGTLALTSPPNGNIAPPGYYMLFLIDSAGVPSVARFIQISPFASPPPASAGIASPAADMTIAAGGSLFFSTDPVAGAATYAWVFPGGSPGSSAAQIPGFVQFNAPGEYTVSMTVIDTAGNSDPNPPTRKITVTPPAPDFDVDISPSSQTVTPGGSSTFTVTITPLSGFAGPVSLSVGSESGFPAGISSGGFSPATITGSGSSTLTMNTTASTNPYALSLTVTAASGGISHAASTTLIVSLARPATPTATAGNNQVALSWPASAGATTYHVKRSPVSGGPYVTVGCSTTTSFTDTGLTNGTTYFYVVSGAFSAGPNSGGESPPSGEVAAAPQASPPGAPTGLTATAGNAQVALSWNASAGATSYHVKRSTLSGGPYTTVASPSATTFTDTGLTNGTTYFYVVTAVNTGGESASSAQASATPTGSPPLAPGGLVASTGKAKGSVNLGWTQSTTPGITQNRIYRRTSSGSYPAAPTATLAPTTTFSDRALTSRATYCYQVTAVNGAGESVRSNESCAAAK